MRIPPLSVLAACCAVGLTAVTEPADAKFGKGNKSGQDDPVQQPEEPGPPDHANSNSKGYPNGRPWQAVEYDFMDVKRRIGYVKDDTEEIIRRLGDVDTDLGFLKGGQETILKGIGRLEDGQVILGEAIEAQGNVLEVQVRVGKIIDPVEVGLDPSTVILYVQVIRNGAGVTGLGADAFSYYNAVPTDDAASYCGTVVCFKEPAGGKGLYILEISAGDAGDYAATLGVVDEGDDVSIDSDDSNGASIVTFEIEDPVVADPA